jgi:hypothetical protein
MSNDLSCLYYALGGGLGHGVRSLALARQLSRRLGGRHLLLFNTPFKAPLEQAVASEPGLACRILAPQVEPAGAEAFLADVLSTFRPDVVVTDTFPRGLGGELAAILPERGDTLRILVSRHLPAAYVERYNLIEFTSQHYDLIVAPGEPSPFAGVLEVLRTAPFLIRDAAELPPTEAASAVLHTTTDRPVVLVTGSGTLAECDEAARLAAELAKHWSDDLPPLRLALPPGVDSEIEVPTRVTHFPLLECLPAVRLLIAAAGYNTVNEAKALRVPALYRPRQRQYDYQAGRVAAERCYHDVADLLPLIRHELEKPRPPLAAYANGAGQAAALIQSRCVAGVV